MKCVIFAAMPVSAQMLRYCEDTDIVIAADAGWHSASKLGIEPDIFLGDFDSAEVPQGKDVLHLPQEKDDTDTLYAARKAIALGAHEVVILGGLGGRFDHTIANLHTLLFLQSAGVHAVLADEKTEITVLSAGTHTIRAQKNVYLSLFPAGESAQGVTLQGVKYPLTNATLTNTYPVGVSNEFAAEKAQITLKKGQLYCILAAKE